MQSQIFLDTDYRVLVYIFISNGLSATHSHLHFYDPYQTYGSPQLSLKPTFRNLRCFCNEKAVAKGDFSLHFLGELFL